MPRLDGQALVRELVETFCHRNIATAVADKDFRLWRLDLEGMEVSVALSKDGMIVTFFSRLTGAMTLSAEIERAFLRKLLQVNLTLVGPTFALSQAGELCLSSSRSVEDLDYNEFAFTIVAFRATFRKYRTLVEKVLDLGPAMTPSAARTEVERHMSVDPVRESEIGAAMTADTSPGEPLTTPSCEPAATGPSGAVTMTATTAVEMPGVELAAPGGPSAEPAWDFGFEQNSGTSGRGAVVSRPAKEGKPPAESDPAPEPDSTESKLVTGVVNEPSPSRPEAGERSGTVPQAGKPDNDEWNFGV